MIRLIEELSLNAWPAAQTLHFDGWVLRFSGGYTRRANSINPLYPAQLDLDEKIRDCEAHYRAQGLPVIFKITPDAQPAGLDAHLAGLGYRQDAVTSVQTLQLSGWDQQPSGVTFSPEATPAWEDAFARMSGIPERSRAAHREILRAILPQACYAALHAEGRAAACGLAVLQAGYVGLYDIVTDAACRRMGFGERLVRGLLGWATEQGARMAYLQVMLNNPPALRLYEKIGFQEQYRYWYRVKDE